MARGMARDVRRGQRPCRRWSVLVSEREIDFQTLTGPVRKGEIPWSVQGYLTARAVVERARRGELRLPTAIADLSPEELALGLWLRREHAEDPPEVPAAHHLRYHAIEAFLARHADLLEEERLLVPREEREGEDEAGGEPSPVGYDPSPLLVDELATRPYDSPLSGDAPPGFDASEVLKAVARRARLD